jgi:hypothetical protein
MGEKGEVKEEKTEQSFLLKSQSFRHETTATKNVKNEKKKKGKRKRERKAC